MSKTKLIHCSFDLVDRFEPRVPDSRIEVVGMEDAETPRICVAPSILHCPKAIPKSGETIRWMQAVGLKPIIHAYYLQSDNVYQPTKDQVADVGWTKEMWVLDKPKDWRRRDYEIVSCCMTDGKDMFGNDVVCINSVELKPAPYTDSLKELVEGMDLEYGEFMRRFPFLTFRGMATNVTCTKEIRERIRESQKHRAFKSLSIRVEAYRNEQKERQETEATNQDLL